MRQSFLLAAIAALIAAPMHAQKHVAATDNEGHNTTGYTAANAAGCKVWVPLQLHAPDYIPKYTGACANGLAQGKGELRWLYNDPSITRPKTTWQGFFQDGVYVGDTPLAKRVEPQPRSNDYWVHFAPIAAGEILVIAKANSDGQMDLCAPDFINISLNAHTSATDDVAVKQAMSDAAAKLQACLPQHGAQRHPGEHLHRALRDRCKRPSSHAGRGRQHQLVKRLALRLQQSCRPAGPQSAGDRAARHASLPIHASASTTLPGATTSPPGLPRPSSTRTLSSTKARPSASWSRLTACSRPTQR